MRNPQDLPGLTAAAALLLSALPAIAQTAPVGPSPPSPSAAGASGQAATVAADPNSAAGAPPPAVPSDTGAPAPEGSVSLNLEVVAKALNKARIGIEPPIGASTYTLTHTEIQDMPLGSSTPITDVELQMPGVNQDNLANGNIHVRNEHLDVQYRIDGVIIPEGVSFFGQDLSARFVESMQLITGALPAQYGLRTAGIIDIQSKSGLFQPGGSFTMYGGSYATVNPSLEYGGSVDGYNYFITGSFLQTNHGINAVTPAYNQIHDQSDQTHEFAYIEKILDPHNKISVMAGYFDGQFQIPNNPGQATFPGLTAINGMPISAFNSALLTEHQVEGAEFGAVSFLHSQGPLDFQISALTKYSFLHYHPDLFGDLAFNGIAEEAKRTSWANVLQAEGTYRLSPDHTLRGGLLISGERVTANANSDVLAQTGTDAFGNPIFATTMTAIAQSSGKTSFSYSAYIQDEWKALRDLTVNYGLRLDDVNGYTIGWQLSPRLNTVWKATPSTTVHAGYASYFTPPPQELVSTEDVAAFAGTSGAPPSTGNGAIKNESAQYLDIGVIQDVLPGLKAGIDLYYKYARNLLDEGQFGAPIILTPFNYRFGYNQGIELTADYRTGNFDFYGNVAIAKQKAKGIESAQFNFSPDDLVSAGSMLVNTDHSQLYTASSGVAYTWHRLRFAVDMVYGSGLRTVHPGDTVYNGGTVPSYAQVNLNITRRFQSPLGGPIDVRFSVINLLDEIYLLRSMTGVGEFANQYGPRRTIYLGVTKEF